MSVEIGVSVEERYRSIREGAARDADRTYRYPGAHDPVMSEYRGLEGPLLPILHGLQEEFGYVPQESLPVIAEALNLAAPKFTASFPSITISASTRPAGMC